METNPDIYTVHHTVPYWRISSYAAKRQNTSLHWATASAVIATETARNGQVRADTTAMPCYSNSNKGLCGANGDCARRLAVPVTQG
jgi:hypothetical protein